MQTLEGIKAVKLFMKTGIVAVECNAVVFPEFADNHVVLGSGCNQYAGERLKYFLCGLLKLGDTLAAIDSTPFMVSGGYPSRKFFDPAIDVFTDGACSNNGNDKAAAGYAVIFLGFPDFDVTARFPARDKQTSNRAEYFGVLCALLKAIQLDPSGTRPLRIHTDSRLLIDSLEKRIYVWRTNGWKSAEGSAVANSDLLMKIDELITTRKEVKLVHVAAHAGGLDWESRWNAEADRRVKNVLKI